MIFHHRSVDMSGLALLFCLAKHFDTAFPNTNPLLFPYTCVAEFVLGGSKVGSEPLIDCNHESTTTSLDLCKGRDHQ